MDNQQSPCINICRYNSTNFENVEVIYCVGCYRLHDEISNWSSYSDSEKQLIKTKLEIRKVKFNL